MASRDFTIDQDDGMFILIPHTQVAREWLSDRIRDAVIDTAVKLDGDKVLDMANELRSEGFRVNT